LNPLAYAMEL